MADDERQRQLDAAARKQGFPSYEAYRLFNEQRARHTGGTIEGAGGRPVVTPTPAPRQVSPAAQRMTSWNPLAVFQHIADTLRGAR